MMTHIKGKKELLIRLLVVTCIKKNSKTNFFYQITHNPMNIRLMYLCISFKYKFRFRLIDDSFVCMYL